MSDTERSLLGLAIVMVLIGLWAWNDHGRALECRKGAVATGAVIEDAIKLCAR